MCQCFSAISDGNGKTLFFNLEQIVEIEKAGNSNQYNWNSHTSIAHFNNIIGSEEDKWNKWEYDCEKKELNVDKLNTKNDSEIVKQIIEKYLADNNALYCQKIYNYNSGNRNSGNRNSGNRNSGNCNSGNYNSDNYNSGYFNTDKPKIRIFNKETDMEIEGILFPDYFYFDLVKWISVDQMTEQEKELNPSCNTIRGYLKKLSYKEAWIESFEKATKKDIELTLNLPNFDYVIFENITGITKERIERKLYV